MTDVIKRLALQELLNEEEQDVCNRIMGDANLYTIITAAFRKAEAEGFKCHLSLSRRAKNRAAIIRRKKT